MRDRRLIAVSRILVTGALLLVPTMAWIPGLDGLRKRTRGPSEPVSGEASASVSAAETRTTTAPPARGLSYANAISVLRARSRLIKFGVSPLLIFSGLALVSGSFSLPSFAQGNSQGDWAGFDCREFHTWPDLPEEDQDYGEYLGKDVGAFEAVLVPADPDGDQSFTVAVTGAYPSYGIICDVAFTVGVQGGPDVELGSPQIEPLLNLTCDSPSPSGMQCDEMTVILTAPEPNECVSAGTEHDATLVFHVEQLAQEATNYGLSIEIPAFDCVNETVSLEEPEDPQASADPRDPSDPADQRGSFSDPGSTGASRPLLDQVAGVKVLPSTGNGGLLSEEHVGTGMGTLLIVVGLVLAFAGRAALRRRLRIFRV
jgi:hypothetical protein